MTDVIEKQRQALIVSIKEADTKEKQRIKRLSLVKDAGEQQALLARFEKERSLDKQRIEQLSNDFFTLKQCSADGQLSDFMEQRHTIKQSMRRGESNPENFPNRFAGLADYDAQLFHVDIVKKFDRHDAKFENKQKIVPYNPREEVRKMRLLQEKRDLLQQLIVVESKASNGTINCRRNADNFSVHSGSSGTSSATYATFATTSQMNRIPSETGRKINVPKLNIS